MDTNDSGMIEFNEFYEVIKHKTVHLFALYN